MGVMGRRPGVSSDETREALLAATMKVLSRRGYGGTRVSEIAAEAGVTPGAIYKHYSSKEDLLAAAILEHLPDVVSQALVPGPGITIIDLTRRLGYSLPDRAADLAPVLLELVAAAGRDEAVAKLARAGFADREQAFEELVRIGQQRDEVDRSLDAAALARYTTMVVLGSIIAAALGFEPIERKEWDAVIGRMIDAVRPQRA